MPVSKKKTAKNNSILAKELHNYFGFDTFKGDQEAIIESILNKKDTFVIMPTGGGNRFAINFPL